MTQEQLSQLKPEEKRIRIAEIVSGFRDFDWLVWCEEEGSPYWEGRKLHGSSPNENVWHPIPDYLSSLDAMHEAVRSLWEDEVPESTLNIGMYLHHLCEIVGSCLANPKNALDWFKVHNASPSQMADALLLTME